MNRALSWLWVIVIWRDRDTSAAESVSTQAGKLDDHARYSLSSENRERSRWRAWQRSAAND